jgi:hypothetical protein
VQSKEPDLAWKPTSGLQLFRRDSDLKPAAIQGVFDAIRAGSTPVVGLKLPESFFRPAAPWVIRSAGKIHGGHAVVGAGIGRYQGNAILLIRNSWGLGWADRGYAWLDEALLRKHLVGVIHLTGDLT